MKPEIHFQYDDVASELANLGLKLEPLHQVGAAWLLAIRNWTPNHPRVYRGLSAWAEGVKTAREGLHPLGWYGVEEKNYPLTVHPSGDLALAIVSGDYDTGVVEGNPKNKVPKGPRTAELVQENRLVHQTSLFDEADLPPLPEGIALEDKAERTTYLLLVCVDTASSEIRSELSLPMSMNDEGVITSWKKRIILPSTSFGGEPEVKREPDLPDLNIDVTRKVA